MKDVTTTSFGLVIAYLLPGFVGLYSLSFWLTELQEMLHALTTQSTAGLFLLVVVAALVVGLVLNSLRWVIYERWHPDKLKTDELAKLGTNQQKLAGYLQRIDENFRYHQFYGSVSIVLPILYAGWVSASWTSSGRCSKIASLLSFLIVWASTIWVGREAYTRYLKGSRAILESKGE